MVKTSSKSSNHKETNRFKFETFSERIAHINIDVIHRSRRTETEPQSADSFFAEGLAKWRELNCTQDFVNFSYEISSQVQSFAQLVHFEDQIVSALQTHLKVPNSLAYIPLLDLVVQLARDLQTDFYPHFREFFEIVVSLLDTQDTELIEGAFQCLCYLFKFLWRYLVRDIQDVYSMYSPLLGENQKGHVKRFAAESFAFLMRKVKGHGQLFDFMLGTLQENPEQAKGLGCLLFDMLKGVRHQTHSCTEKILPVLLSRLGPCSRDQTNPAAEKSRTSLPWDQVLLCFQELVQCLSKYLHREHSKVIWDALLNEASSLQKTIESPSTKQAKSDAVGQLDRLVQLIDQLVEWGNGSLIAKPEELCEVVLALIQKQSLPETHGKTVLCLTSSLLQATKGESTQDHVTQLVDSVFKSKYSCSLVLDFSRNVFDIAGFEQDILSPLCEYCHSQMIAGDDVAMETILFTLTDLIVAKRPGVEVGSDLVNYKPYILDFSRQIQLGLAKSKKTKKKKPPREMSFPKYLLDQLDISTKDCGNESKLHRVWASITCLPHVKPVETSDAIASLQKTISVLRETSSNNDSIVYILSAAVQSLLLISKTNQPSAVLEKEFVISLLRTHSSSPHILLAVDAYLSLCEVADPKTDPETDTETDGEPILTTDTLTELFPILEENLTSAFSELRRLTLRILDKFPVVLPTVDDLPFQQLSVFRLCLQAEEDPVAIETYRDKLNHLRKLEYSVAKYGVPDGGFETVTLRFLIGQLYVNFQLLWEPVADIIKTHAYGLNKTVFWDVYGRALRQAAAKNESSLFYERSSLFHQTQHRNPNLSRELSESDAGDLRELFGSCYGDASRSEDRPDHPNFRRLLWRSMEGFADRAEGKSRELAPLLLQFMRDEYYVTDVNSAPTQDLRQVKGQATSQSEEGNEDENLQEEENKKGKKKRPVNKSLVGHLTLFSKFKDPKSLYLEPQLRELYLNLLSSRNPDIQKGALACLYTYNYKHLTPYRENLDQLMDDKLFREALVKFAIDETSGIVDAMHRAELLPILFRILYGKMLSKTGPGTQGKGGIATRRSVILRFIAGSSAREMTVFMDLVMEPCKHLISDDLDKMYTAWISPDVGSVVPLRKQHSMLDTIGVIFSKLGHLIEPFLPTLFRLVTCAVAGYNTLLSQREKLQPYFISQLKGLRQVGLQRLTEFFARFDEYAFSGSEVETVFKSVVWPQLQKLSSESLTGPSLLLKLAYTWSQNARYHPLLIKQNPEDDLTLLDQAIALLASPKVGQSVVTMVMEMVENLLTLKEDDEEEEEVANDDGISSISLENLLPGPEGANLSLGSRMLLPHISAILTYLNSSIQIRQKPASKAAPTLPLKELGILYKMSAFVQASELCSSLVGLLLPYLQKASRLAQNTEVEILTTMKNLMKLVDEPRQFLSPLSRLLYRVTAHPSRLILVQVFSAMATKDPSLDEIVRTVARINSWDRKRLEEPDFALRLKAFRLAHQKLEERNEALDMNFFTPLIHNCFYFILKIDEMALRDNASHLLSEVIKRLEEEGSETSTFTTLIEHFFIPALRDGLRAKTEVARHESVAILSRLVQAFPNHPHFITMSVLLDKDVEIDFFENIRHIQHHRRMRALRRLSKHCQDGELSPKVVQHFLLPTATSMIFDPEVAKNMNLVVEAVAAVGGMATVLPWQQYLKLLTQYLRLLMKGIEYQKIATRLIVAVLDAFHFDLSLSTGVTPKRVGGTEETSKEEAVEEDEAVEKEDETADNEGTDKGKEDDEDGEDEEEEEKKEEEEGEDESGDDSGIEEETDKKEREKEKAVALATKIHLTIIKSILPQLHKIITKKSKSEGQHKRARDRIAQDEEVLRVPIALAVIKLLQALPKETMDQHLYGVLLKVCQMLRSRALDLRNITRDTLVKILDSLGVKYFGLVLKQLRNCLTRGFELHVLGFTIHMLLKNILPKLSNGDLDSSVSSLIQVFNQELFGQVSEEKEVEGIVGKLLEARSIKAYDCYEMVSKFIGQGSITKLIVPLKEILDNSNSHRAVNRVRETLRRCSIGLQDNAGVSQEALLIFIHGLTSETLPLLRKSNKPDTKKSAPPKPGQRPASTYLVPRAPTRAGPAPENSSKTHLHLLVEFGLQLLNTSLKRSKLVSTNEQHLSMLDPFTVILLRSMESQHTRVITNALRCLCWLLRYPLPTLNDTVKQLTQTLFRLLRKHARVGAAKGDNFELMVVTFKAVTVLIRDVKNHSISEKQLQVLLAYAEEDIHDYTRQATAFGLLKAILTRKLIAPEMHSIMDKISQLSVTNQSPAVRLQCRQVMHQFLLDYPLGKKLKRHLDFYVKQLSFSMEAGRESALEMLATIYSTFPQNILVEYGGLFFIPMATRLVNDDSAKCRKLTALALVTLLEKLTLDKRDELFSITVQWLQDDKPAHQRLAAQLTGIFVEAEKEDFNRRLAEILPVISHIMKPENLVEEEDDIEESEVKAQDHLLFHVMSALTKISRQCHLPSYRDQSQVTNQLWESIESHLLHPHTWVRLMAARLFGELFAASQPDDLVAMVTDKLPPTTPDAEFPTSTDGKKKKKKKSKLKIEEVGVEGKERKVAKATDWFEYLHGDLKQRMMGLADKFCRQLNASTVTKELADQVIKNLIFISKVVRRLCPIPTVTDEEHDQGDANGEGSLGREDEEIEDERKDVEEEDDEGEENEEEEESREDGQKEEEEEEGDEETLSMGWLVKKMSRIAATEVAKTAKVTMRRTSVIKWMAATALDLGQRSVRPYLPSMLQVVGREINDKAVQSDSELKVLCQEVLELLKSLVGLETFSAVYASVQRSANETRMVRKRKRALEAVADPDKAAMRKMRKQQLKKEARKRKLQLMRPTYQINKRPKLKQR